MTDQPEGNIVNYPRYDFEILDRLILDQLNPEFADFTLDEDNLELWKSISQTQQSEIKRSITSKAFGLLNEKQARCLIQNYQVHINYLIQSLNGYSFSQQPNELQYKLVVEDVREHLESLLLFLNYRYKQFFDFEADATPSYKKLISVSLQPKLDRLFACMPDQRSELFSIVLTPIWDFLSDDYKRISYHRLHFYERLLDEIIQTVMDGLPFEKTLKYLLIRLNFNAIRFFDFLTTEVKRDLEEKEGYHSRIEVLSNYLKKYNQIHLFADIAYNPRQKHIKELIVCWIFEEIDHLDRSKKPQFMQGQNMKPGLPDDFKVQIDLSVAQLGYILKLLFEVGVIKNKNQSEVLKFIAGNSRSRQAEIISHESLRTKFYNVEEGTRDVVKAIVIRMLNQIHKNS